MVNHHQNLHRGLLERAPAPDIITMNGVVMSVVYVTARPTFTGIIGSMSTAGIDDDDNFSSTTRPIRSVLSSTASSTTLSQRMSSSTSRYSLQSPSSTAPSSALLGPTAVYSSVDPAQAPSNTAVYGAGSTDASTNSAPSEGMPLGAKIGLAVGAICGVGVLAALILLLLARKRRQMKQEAEAETEKNNSTRPHVTDMATASAPGAPKLTLRPVSKLVSEFVNNTQQKNRLSQGNMLNSINESGDKNRNLASSQAIPLTTRPSTDRPRTGDNPFRDPENPFADPEKMMRKPVPTNDLAIGPLAPAVVIGTAVATATAESPTSQRTSEPRPESFPLPQSQNHTQNVASTQAPQSGSALAPLVIPNPSTQFELPGAPSPIVAPGPGPEAPQSNVYRILMDFRPTMEDELELRAGQLVRLLHEYDDGWALCIRLDRSQQGVVPRTCLAARPSKPRPGPPPTGPGSRPITPQGRPRGSPGQQGPPGPGFSNPRAQGPNPNRAQSPSSVSADTGAFNQPPRPLSPGPRPQPQSRKRSMSPGPYGAGGPKPMASEQQRRRSNSAGAVNFQNKRLSPVGPSKLGPGSPPPVRSDSPGLAM